MCSFGWVGLADESIIEDEVVEDEVVQESQHLHLDYNNLPLELWFYNISFELYQLNLKIEQLLVLLNIKTTKKDKYPEVIY